MAAHTIHFEPLGRRGTCRRDQSLLDCARQLGMRINSVCGGLGTCLSCKVRILGGTASEPAPSEIDSFSHLELADGWRLACQTYPTSDCEVNVPIESMTTAQRTQVEGLEIAVKPEPPVKAYRLELSPPSLSDSQADADRVLESLNRQHRLGCKRIDIDVLRSLSAQLRDQYWECQASIRQDEVVAINQPSSRQLGLAVDLGTTKAAGYLVDLGNGKTLASKGIANPQISYGADIIGRIANAAKQPETGTHLRDLAVEAVNHLAFDLCADVNATVDQIVEAVVVGNTAMHHLLLGLPVRQLAMSPYVPAVSMALDIRARDMGIHIATGGYVHILPNIAGFVGADHVAVLLATQLQQAKGTVLVIDIGTNTEVSLISGGRIACVSCASGPAFEGYHIRHGMRASSGAIEHVRIVGEDIWYQTIDGASPVGICGSGVVDTLGQLYRAGIIDERGRMIDGHPRVRMCKRQREFVLVSEDENEGRPAIVFTQKDVRALQLAKAAIRTGVQVLLEMNGCSEEEIEQVLLAGAFGTYMGVSSAIAIGMLPPLPVDCFRQMGNAAGTGARLALISLSQRAQAKELASRVRYVELATAPGFAQTFLQASFLGRYRLMNGKREKAG